MVRPQVKGDPCQQKNTTTRTGHLGRQISPRRSQADLGLVQDSRNELFKLKSTQMRCFLLMYAAICGLWAFYYPNAFSLLVSGLFCLGAFLLRPSIGPLAAIVAAVGFALDHYVDSSACILLALLVQPPPKINSNILGVLTLAAACLLVGAGVVVDRLYPCLLYTPYLYLVVGCLTAPAFLLYFSVFVRWQWVGGAAVATGIALRLVAPWVPKLEVGGPGCKESPHNVGSAIECYAADHKGKYPTKLEEVVPQYIQQLPRCPITPRGLNYEKSASNFTISCVGQHLSGLHSRDSGWIYSNSAGRSVPP